MIKTCVKRIATVMVLVVVQTFLASSFVMAASTGPWKSVAYGSGFFLGVKSDGTLWAWGANEDGALGDGTTRNHSTPEQIGTDTNWMTVSANVQSFALKTNGTLWAWGDNYFGELGDGSLTNKTAPEQVGTGSWKAVAAGYGFTLAVKSDGSLWETGNYIATFAQLGSDTDWSSLSASYSHAMLVKTNGTLWGMGDNSSGELGIGNTAGFPTNPVQVGIGTNWKSASAGNFFTAAIKTDGTLWTWGLNIQDELGNGISTSPQPNPTQLGTLTNWQSVSAGTTDSLAIKTDGTLWSWGANQEGEEGDGTLQPRNTPEQIGNDTSWQIPVAGADVSLATKNDGSLWTWGYNASNELGYGFRGLRPVSAGLGPLLSYSCGSQHSVAVKQNGTLWAWGNNQAGQLGDGTTTSQKTPEQIGVVTNWSFVTAGGSNTFAIKTDGTLWAWGSNQRGSLGDGTTFSRQYPEQIGTDTKWQTISATYYCTLGIKTDGTLWAWGDTFSGQLGLGPVSPPYEQFTPIQVGSATNWKSVSTAGQTSVAVKTDGTLWAWGQNQNGELGDGTVSPRTSPEQIGGSTNWRSVSEGEGFTVAMKTDGTLWSWGNNQYGNLGDGSTNQHNTPEQISSSVNWAKAVAGQSQCIATMTDGTLWAWGNNQHGELGDGTSTQQNAPDQIGSLASWTLVGNSGMSSADFTFVSTTEGTLWGWGDNSSEQLAMAGLDPTVPEIVLPMPMQQTLDFPSVVTTLNTPVTLSAMASSGLPITYSASGPVSLVGNQLIITGTSPVNLIAYQLGNTEWDSSGPVSSAVMLATKKSQCIDFPEISDKRFGAHSIKLKAFASSGLPVSFLVTSGPAVITGDLMTFIGAGLVTVQATQEGNQTYDPAPAVSHTIHVIKAFQVITFPRVPHKHYGDPPFSIFATASSGLPVTFRVVSGPANLSGSMITLTGQGRVTVEATQNGDQNFSAAQKIRHFGGVQDEWGDE